MRKENAKSRALARMLAEEFKKVTGSDPNPVYATVEPSGKKDITDANNGDVPAD